MRIARMGRLRLFFVLFFVFTMLKNSSMEAFAMDKNVIRIHDDRGTITKEVSSENLFDEAMFPGSILKNEISVINELEKPIYYEWECSALRKNSLYNSLKLKISYADDEIVYSGSLKDLNVLIGPHQSKTTEKFVLELSMPEDTGSEAAGLSSDFDMLFTFKSSSSHAGGSGSGDSDTDGTGGGNGDKEENPEDTGDESHQGEDSGSGGDSGNNDDQGSGKPGSGNTGDSDSSQSGNGNSSGDQNGNAGGNTGGNGDGSSGSGSGSGIGTGDSGGNGTSGGASGNGSGGSGSGGTGRPAVSTGNGSGGGGSFGSDKGFGNGVEQKDNIIIGSKFDRPSGGSQDADTGSGSNNGAGGNASGTGSGVSKGYGSGFAANSEVNGGGEEKTYSRLEPGLKKGIDTGTWEKDADGFWKYLFSDGSPAKGGFALIKNPFRNKSGEYCWYCFDADGRLMIGWIKAENDIWYHSHELPDGDLGAIEVGWIYGSEDNELYYTSEINAVMLTGWIGFAKSAEDEAEYYYFAKLSDTYRQNWFLNTALGRWIYDKMGFRSYGSMYKDEQTPDGYTVDADGKYIR